MQSTIVVVAPGDLIRGIVTGTGCDTTGVCQSWTVTTTDVTSGKSTTLNTTAPNGVPNGVSPGSLETYDVSSCDMFPGGGTTTFMNNTLVGPNSAVQTPKYNLINFQGVNAEVPKTCGYAGMASGNNYTLVYGKVTGGNDGGVADSGRSPDASVDARNGGGTGGSGSVSDGGSADRGSVDAARARGSHDRVRWQRRRRRRRPDGNGRRERERRFARDRRSTFGRCRRYGVRRFGYARFQFGREWRLLLQRRPGVR